MTTNVIQLHPPPSPIHGPGRPDAYTLKDGTKVPGVTTITGRYGDKQALIGWAFKHGKSGAASLYEKRDDAADAGTMVHQWVVDHVQARVLTEYPNAKPDVVENALTAFRAFLEWLDMAHAGIAFTEVPLISEQYRFGGTLDAGLYPRGKRIVRLADWKSGNGIYPEMVAQIAAYRHLMNENGLENDGAAWCIRFSKNTGSYTMQNLTSAQLDKGWEWFKRARHLHDVDDDLAQVLK